MKLAIRTKFFFSKNLPMKRFRIEFNKNKINLDARARPLVGVLSLIANVNAIGTEMSRCSSAYTTLQNTPCLGMECDV